MRDMSTTVAAASVLVPILAEDDGYQVLFTVRSEHLRRHPGQIGFPGGMAEAIDASSQATALREAFEEIALEPSLVTILFDLPIQRTSTHVQVTPWVGLVHDYAPQSASNEVAGLLKVPLSMLLTPDTYQLNRLAMAAHSVHKYQFYWDNQLIWGATASICYSLCLVAAKLKPYLSP